MKKNLMSEVLRHVQSNSLGSILTEDGMPDIPNIRRLDHIWLLFVCNVQTFYFSINVEGEIEFSITSSNVKKRNTSRPRIS